MLESAVTSRAQNASKRARSDVSYSQVWLNCYVCLVLRLRSHDADTF